MMYNTANFPRRSGLIWLAMASIFFSCNKDIQEPGVRTTENNTSKFTEERATQPIADQYIVHLDGALLDHLDTKVLDYPAQSLMAREIVDDRLLQVPGLEKLELLGLYSNVFFGVAVKADAEQLRILESLDAVQLIEQDQTLSLVGSAIEKDPGLDHAKAQETPYGINRVGKASGQGKRAWILDTGIDLDHPDLDVNTQLSKSFVDNSSGGCGLLGIIFGCDDSEEPSPEDGHGHGSHVAGTVAALNNNLGVIGVAYGAEVVALKVLGDNGSGSVSGIVQAVDYMADYAGPGDVANMSLGGGTSTSLDNAVKDAAADGILFSLAAGNDSQHANKSSPGRVNGANIYTVSAMNSSDNFASFSNYGNPPVDFCAPGVSVKSTYKNGGYATMSGTSMAAPHVAGLLLITGGNLGTDGFVKNDPDGQADPIAHQ